MSKFPSIGHVAVTVTDLTVSRPWYERLIDAAGAALGVAGAALGVAGCLSPTMTSHDAGSLSQK